jgi:hypothetical protein
MSQAEVDALKEALIQVFSVCGWEALLVCRSTRISLPPATLYLIYAGERQR